MKINVHAAVNTGTSKMGLRCLIRDDKGMLVTAEETSWHGRFSTKEAEVIVVHKALKWTKSKQLDYIRIESNVLTIIQGLQNFSMNNSFDLLNDIRKIASDFSNICCKFVKRSTNMASHSLA